MTFPAAGATLRTVPCSWSLAACLCVSAILLGCAGAPPRRHHHSLLRDDDDAAAGGSASPPLGPWPAFSRLSTFMAVADVPHSAHRVGTDFGRISRSPDAFEDLKRPQPPGAVLLEALSTGPDAPPEQYFAMERTRAGDGWTYWVVDPTGAADAAGTLALCARCHAEAGPTGVFGP
jgi:hypothetical protein